MQSVELKANKAPGTTSPYMRRGEILVQATETLSTPQQITEFYGSFMKIYEGAPNIPPELVERRAASDLAYHLHRLEPAERRSVWLMSLPLYVSEMYNQTTPSGMEYNRSHRKNAVNRIMDEITSIRQVLQKARTRMGFIILGVNTAQR